MTWLEIYMYAVGVWMTGLTLWSHGGPVGQRPAGRVVLVFMVIGWPVTVPLGTLVNYVFGWGEKPHVG